jgi:rod shape-determining protein MreD
MIRRGSLALNVYLAIFVLGGMALLQSTVVPVLSIVGVKPSLVLLLVVAWSIVRGGADGAIWGFVGGLALDLLSGGPWGVSTLALTVVGLLAGLAEVNLSRNNLLFPTALTFGASLLYDLLCVAVLSLAGWRVPLLDTLLVTILPTAILNVLLSFAVLPLMIGLNRLVGGGRQLRW